MSDETTETTTPEPAPTPEPTGRTVPYDRFSEVVNQLRAAERQLAAVETERDKAAIALERLQADSAKQLEDVQKQMERLKGDAEWGERAVQLAANGYTDPRVLRIIRREFEERDAPEEGEPPAWEDWWTSNADDYGSLFGGGAKGANGTPQRTAPPKVDRDTKSPAAGALSESALLSMSQEEWRALGSEGQAAIKAQVLGGQTGG